MENFIETRILDYRNSENFLSKLKYGYLFKYPYIYFCQLEYDVQYYQDFLFVKYNIHMPKKIRNSSILRKAEYLAGRYCAAQLLNGFGYHQFSVKSDEGPPLWPRNIYGSISHTKTNAIVLLAKSSHFVSIGVDVERIIPVNVMQDIIKNVLSYEEYALIEHANLLQNQIFSLCFSIKESFYKAIYSQAHHPIDFKAYKINSINYDSRTIVIELCKSINNQYYQGKIVRGYYHISQKNVYTAVISQG